MRLRERIALGALAAILAITATWWTLALWPLPASTPAWLLRTRAVCFGSTSTGLPDAAGWTALIGQPALMLGILLVVWGDSITAGLGAVAQSRVGRITLRSVALVLIGAALAATARVAGATGAGAGDVSAAAVVPAPSPLPSNYPRLERPAPALDLVDQHGAAVTLERFRGRPVLVTFAYAHCETVCPLVVQDVLRARRALADLPAPPAVVVVTLDPWRDTPSRLPSIAVQWRLEGDAVVASGSVAAVEAVLDRWDIARARDTRTGELTHPAVVYVVDRSGKIAYAINGGAEAVAELVRRL